MYIDNNDVSCICLGEKTTLAIYLTATVLLLQAMQTSLCTTPNHSLGKIATFPSSHLHLKSPALS